MANLLCTLLYGLRFEHPPRTPLRLIDLGKVSQSLGDGTQGEMLHLELD